MSTKEFTDCPICEEFFLSRYDPSISNEADWITYVNNRHGYGCTDEKVNVAFLDILKVVNTDLNVVPDVTIKKIEQYFNNETEVSN